jgi:Fur family transcriptional regulator, peroxide stress response regulator
MANFSDRKFKMTPQRAAILDYLEGNTSHPSAEDIFDAVKVDYPMMSFATVYNTIETLRDMGLLWELSIDDQRKRYDPNTDSHHHLICTRCRKVVDVHMEFDLTVPPNQAHGYTLTGRHVEFYGICPQCAEKK